MDGLATADAPPMPVTAAHGPRTLVHTAVAAAGTLTGWEASALLAAAFVSCLADARHPVVAAGAALVAGAAIGARWRPGAATETVLALLAVGVGFVTGSLWPNDETRVLAACHATGLAALIGILRGARTVATSGDPVRAFLAEAQRSPYVVTVAICLVAAADLFLGCPGPRIPDSLRHMPWLAVLVAWQLAGRGPARLGRAAPFAVGVPLVALTVAVHGAWTTDGYGLGPRVLGGALWTASAMGVSWLAERAFVRGADRGRAEPVLWVLLVLVGTPLATHAHAGEAATPLLVAALAPVLIECAARTRRTRSQLVAWFAIALGGALLLGTDGFAWNDLLPRSIAEFCLPDRYYRSGLPTLVRLAECGALLGALAALSRVARTQTAMPPGHPALAGDAAVRAFAASPSAAPLPLDATARRHGRLAFLRAAADVAGSLPWGLGAALLAGAIVADACDVPLPVTIVFAAWAGARSVCDVSRSWGPRIVTLALVAGAVFLARQYEDHREGTAWRHFRGAHGNAGALVIAALFGAFVFGRSAADPRARRLDLAVAAQIRPWLAAASLCALVLAEAVRPAWSAVAYVHLPWCLVAAILVHTAARAPDALDRFSAFVLVPPVAVAVWAWTYMVRMPIGSAPASHAVPVISLALWACVAGGWIARRADGPSLWWALPVAAVAVVPLLGAENVRATTPIHVLAAIAVAPLAVAVAGSPSWTLGRRVAACAAAGVLVAAAVGVLWPATVGDWWTSSLGIESISAAARRQALSEVVFASSHSSRAAILAALPDASTTPALVFALHAAVLGALAGIAGAFIHRVRGMTAIPPDHPVFTEGPYMRRYLAADAFTAAPGTSDAGGERISSSPPARPSDTSTSPDAG